MRAAVESATPVSHQAGSAAAQRSAQPAVAASALALLAAGVIGLSVPFGARHGALFLVGGGLGFVLHQAAFGFTTAFRAFAADGDGRGMRAQLVMLALTTVVFAPLLASGEVLGQPVGGAVAPASLSVLVGAALFTIGMQLGGGWASGTLFQLGAGTPSLGLTLLAFVAGSVIATFHAPFWATMPSLGAISLGDRLGWGPAVVVQLLAFGLLAGAIRHVERRRHRPAVARGDAGRGRERWLRGPWPLVVGAAALAGLNALTLALAGHPWTVTWAFTLWGGKALQALGYDLSAVPFWTGEFQQAALAAPVLADVTSVMDVGLVVGALLGAGLAGRFAPGWRIAPRVVAVSLVGGLLLGYGARIAFGCNIGAFVSGIASTSMHGWLWALGALVGTPLGVHLRARFMSIGHDAAAPAC